MEDYKDYSIRQLKNSYVLFNRELTEQEDIISELKIRLYHLEKTYAELDGSRFPEQCEYQLTMINEIRTELLKKEDKVEELRPFVTKMLKALNEKRAARPISQDSLCLLE